MFLLAVTRNAPIVTGHKCLMGYVRIAIKNCRSLKRKNLRECLSRGRNDRARREEEMTCRLYGPNVVICGPSPKDIKPYKKKKPEMKWCFGCRKRTLHHWWIIYEEHGYYDPMIYPKCERCGKDMTLFPGMEYVE